MSASDHAEIFRSMQVVEQVPASYDNDSPSDHERLVGAFKALNQKHHFTSGDLVRWKAGLSNRPRPVEGAAVIVVDVLSEPLMDHENNSGSPYFREPLTITVGDLDSDGDFTIWHLDVRRLEPFV